MLWSCEPFHLRLVSPVGPFRSSEENIGHFEFIFSCPKTLFQQDTITAIQYPLSWRCRLPKWLTKCVYCMCLDTVCLIEETSKQHFCNPQTTIAWDWFSVSHWICILQHFGKLLILTLQQQLLNLEQSSVEITNVKLASVNMMISSRRELFNISYDRRPNRQIVNNDKAGFTVSSGCEDSSNRIPEWLKQGESSDCGWLFKAKYLFDRFSSCSIRVWTKQKLKYINRRKRGKEWLQIPD